MWNKNISCIAYWCRIKLSTHSVQQKKEIERERNTQWRSIHCHTHTPINARMLKPKRRSVVTWGRTVVVRVLYTVVIVASYFIIIVILLLFLCIIPLCFCWWFFRFCFILRFNSIELRSTTNYLQEKKSNSHHKLQKLSTEKITTQILPWKYGMLCSLWNLSIPSICIWYQEFDKNFAHAHIDKLDFERGPNNGEAGTA